MPGLDVDVLLGSTGFVTLSKELRDTELPVAEDYCHTLQAGQMHMACKTANYQPPSWAGEVGGESKI